MQESIKFEFYMVEGLGEGMDEEDEGETAGLEVFSSVVTRCRRSSSFLVTWIWLEANLAIASSRRSQLDLDRVDSAMVSLLMKAPKLLWAENKS